MPMVMFMKVIGSMENVMGKVGFRLHVHFRDFPSMIHLCGLRVSFSGSLFLKCDVRKMKIRTLLLIGQMMFEADGNILNGTWFEGVRHGDFELSNTEEGTSFQMSYDMGRFGQ